MTAHRRNNIAFEDNGCFCFEGYRLISRTLDCVPMNSRVVVNTISPNSYGLACHDNEMYKALHKSNYLILDGMYFGFWPLLIYGKRIKRITGWDAFVYFADKLNQQSGKMFFLGSSKETLNKIKERMAVDYPNVIIASYSPPYKSEFNDDDNKDMINAINNFAPNVLAIGMTAPKQEKWAVRHIDKLNVNVTIAIGNVFDWYAGNSKRPSQFWCKIGLEWLVRIFLRPEIFRRNIANQMLFFWHLLLRLLRIKK